jgi:hypothetical protein
MMDALGFDFFVRLLINLFYLYVLIWHCYYRNNPNRDFLFSFSLFGIGVFVVSYMLRSVPVSMGFAFGLFAIFSMLRYRTETISIKSMTYLFLVITISLLSAVGQTTPVELILLNGLICICTALSESRLLKPQLTEKVILYEKIENILPQNRNCLLEDLAARTGLEIRNVEIDKIDFLKDTALLRVYHIIATEHDLDGPSKMKWWKWRSKNVEGGGLKW